MLSVQLVRLISLTNNICCYLLNAGASTSCLDNLYTDDLRNLEQAVCNSEDTMMINGMVDDISIEDVKGFIEPSDDMNVTGGLICFPSSWSD